MGVAWVDIWWGSDMDGYNHGTVCCGVVVGTEEGHVEGVSLLYMVDCEGVGAVLVGRIWGGWRKWIYGPFMFRYLDFCSIFYYLFFISCFVLL